MLIGEVRPQTVDGVKSLAAQLRRKQGIKHSNALDIAARAANCSNFRNAQKMLPLRDLPASQSYVFLSQYWCDKSQRHKIGRETLRIDLSKPIPDICPWIDLKAVRGFGDLRIAADDHLVCDVVAHSQEYARNRLLTAERSLRFMEHTGLRPFRYHRKRYPKVLLTDKLPQIDHPTDWLDPVTDQFVLVDEPYGGRDDNRRQAWAIKHGWRILKTSWPGMYNPYACDLYIASPLSGSLDLEALAAKISGMPAPSVEENWAGVSVSSWETFFSPMAKTPQDKRRARSRGTVCPSSSSKSVPCSYGHNSFGRRPVGELGIADHWEAGRIIKAIIASDQRPWGAYQRLNSLRSTLEDWLCLELGSEKVQDDWFIDVYYNGIGDDDPFHKRAESRDGIVSLLEYLKGKLQTAYSAGPPLRKQMKRIDMSISLIERMGPVGT
jgi:Domain of unknown function (DUF5623)